MLGYIVVLFRVACSCLDIQDVKKIMCLFPHEFLLFCDLSLGIMGCNCSLTKWPANWSECTLSSPARMSGSPTCCGRVAAQFFFNKLYVFIAMLGELGGSK